jgi:hypothetical protein
MYRTNSIVDPDVDLRDAGIDMQKDSPIVLGDFVDIERPVFVPSGVDRA